MDQAALASFAIQGVTLPRGRATGTWKVTSRNADRRSRLCSTESPMDSAEKACRERRVAGRALPQGSRARDGDPVDRKAPALLPSRRRLRRAAGRIGTPRRPRRGGTRSRGCLLPGRSAARECRARGSPPPRRSAPHAATTSQRTRTERIVTFRRYLLACGGVGHAPDTRNQTAKGRGGKRRDVGSGCGEGGISPAPNNRSTGARDGRPERSAVNRELAPDGGRPRRPGWSSHVLGEKGGRTGRDSNPRNRCRFTGFRGKHRESQTFD